MNHIEGMRTLMRDDTALIVMTTADWEILKREASASQRLVPDATVVAGNRLWGVEVLASDMWAGPPRAFSRSEADDFRSKGRLADFRTNPVTL